MDIDRYHDIDIYRVVYIVGDIYRYNIHIHPQAQAVSSSKEIYKHINIWNPKSVPLKELHKIDDSSYKTVQEGMKDILVIQINL